MERHPPYFERSSDGARVLFPHQVYSLPTDEDTFVRSFQRCLAAAEFHNCQLDSSGRFFGLLPDSLQMIENEIIVERLRVEMLRYVAEKRREPVPVTPELFRRDPWMMGLAYEIAGCYLPNQIAGAVGVTAAILGVPIAGGFHSTSPRGISSIV